MAVAAIAVGVTPAAAAFPGRDGRIAFHYDRSLYTADADGGGLEKLPEDVPGFGGLSVSKDGTRIVYSASHQLFAVDADGRGNTPLTSTSDAFSDQPSLSPDGRRVAFTRGYGIWVMDADGRHAHAITPAASFADAYSDPAWSPDGRRIAFTLHQQVWLMNADGSGQTDLTPPDEMCPLMTRQMRGEQPDWSPDGSRIAFVGPVTCANSRGTDIWVMNADGSGKADLTPGDGTEDVAPVFSPSGSHLAFTRETATAPRLMLVGASGGAPSAVPLAAPGAEGQDWAPAVRRTRLTERVTTSGRRAVISGKVSPATTGKVTLTVKRGHRTALRRRVQLKQSRFRLVARNLRPGRYVAIAVLPRGRGRLTATTKHRSFRVHRKGHS